MIADVHVCSVSRTRWARGGRRFLVEAAWGVACLFAVTSNVYAQTGACCRSNGTCTIADMTSCESTGGDFLGASSICVANLCKGGCCRPNGDCSLNIARLNCEVNGGTYRGHSSDCTDAVCPVVPNGACCTEFFCQEGFTQDSCGGVWPGDGSTCDDCPGACCLADDSCVASTRGECSAMEGANFPRLLSNCPIDGCGTGACCFASVDPGGNCTGPIDPFNCAGSHGRYQGHGMDCDTATCPRFGGGCCCGGFSCFVATEEECPTPGCTFLGEGVACGVDSQCPGDGACCPGDGGACTVIDGFTCVFEGGTFHGEGTVCGPDDCIAAPVGACCSNAGCAVLSEAECAEFGVRGDWHVGETCEDACPGTCCLRATSGLCVFTLTETECVSVGGDFLGINATCPSDCTPGCSDDAECFDGVDCTDDVCDMTTGLCDNLPQVVRCLDEDPCTTNEHCDVTLDCVFDREDCDDGIDCTSDSCADAGGCLNVPNDEACDDGLRCTVDTCDPVVGCLHGADNTQCDDGVDCTADACRPTRKERDENGCVFDPEDSRCDSKDLCVSGRCDPVSDCQLNPRECPDDGDDCARAFCDPGTGKCAVEELCGACCRVGQACIDGVSPAQCSGVFDTFFGAGTSCDNVSCGACCDPDNGACFDGITEAECESADRAYQGSNTNCAEDPCLGACCDPGFTVAGCAEDVTAEECAQIDADAIFVGVGRTCTSAPCGACCDPTSSDAGISCLDFATDEFCAALGYTYIGDQTTCDASPCRGACCRPDGSCVVAAPEECGGDFRGNGTTCDELNPPCAPFTGGACCRQDDSCIDGTTPETCGDVHAGRYLSDTIRCEDVDCTILGACCMDDGACVQSTESGCVNGTFQGRGTGCAESCQGACCRSDGSCHVGPSAACAGDFRGLGTNCVELNPACGPFAGGACCIDGGECVDGTTSTTCAAFLGGRHQGDTTRCDNIDCNATGACCLDDGSCVQSTETGCFDGDFPGAGSECPEACVPFGDINEDGSVDLRDGRDILIYFGQAVGPGHPGERADLNGNGQVDLGDVALFVQSMTGPG